MENESSLLPLGFYEDHAVTVARNLIGCTLVFNDIEGIITETEAYRGEDDEAAHAYRNLTERSKTLFGPPGHSYVYLIYGIHHCLNIVTEPKGVSSAVLIRSLKLPHIHLNGPGKLCKYLGITRQHNAINLINNKTFHIKAGTAPQKLKATPRIGITRGVDTLWRFIPDD